MISRPIVVALLMAAATLPLAVADGGPDSATSSRASNLTPQSPSTAPLLRKINTKRATMIAPFYCAGVPADQEMDVAVPPFDWGVANDGSGVKETFLVTLRAGKAGELLLATQTVQSIPQSGIRVFRNWPRRPTHVRVVNVTGSNERFTTEYDATPGCYIPTALAGSVVLDPRPLIVRVDAGGHITERVESDNELTR